jgi:hypothetical protein
MAARTEKEACAQSSLQLCRPQIAEQKRMGDRTACAKTPPILNVHSLLVRAGNIFCDSTCCDAINPWQARELLLMISVLEESDPCLLRCRFAVQ